MTDKTIRGVPTSVRLPPDVIKRISEEAASSYRTISQQINFILKKYIEENPTA